MGFLHSNVCYPTVEAARQSACSDASTSWGSGTTLLQADCTTTNFSLSSMTICRTSNGGACTNFTKVYPPFPSCDFDGGTAIALSWFAAAFLLAVTLYGLKNLLGLFDGRHDK